MGALRRVVVFARMEIFATSTTFFEILEQGLLDRKASGRQATIVAIPHSREEARTAADVNVHGQRPPFLQAKVP